MQVAKPHLSCWGPIKWLGDNYATIWLNSSNRVNRIMAQRPNAETPKVIISI